MNKYLRIAVYLLIILLFINFLVSASCYFIYDSLFDPQIAYNILATNFREATSFASTLILPIFVSLIFILIFSYFIEKLSEKIKMNILTVAFSLTWIFMPFLWYHKEKRDIENFKTEHSDRLGVRLIKNKTIFYNYYEFIDGFEQLREVKKIDSVPVDFSNIIKTDTNNSVSKIVVVIGESARRQNMSLYGYERNTTPVAVNEKKNMFIFYNAVSPAPYTHQAVPLTLSSIKFEDYAKRNYIGLNQNVVSIGKEFNYTPYWITHFYSPEERLLGKGAKEIYTTSGYDDSNLLQPLDSLLKINEKQLIVIHFWGSHPDAKNNYPKSFEKFHGNNRLDEYDNSIAYTDYLLGEIIRKLRETNSAMIYYSDHGQEYNYGKFFHAQTKRSNQVPLFVWYSNTAQNEFNKPGSEEQEISTRIVFDLTLNLMGLKSFSSESAYPAKFLENEEVVLFDKLKD